MSEAKRIILEDSELTGITFLSTRRVEFLSVITAGGVIATARLPVERIEYWTEKGSKVLAEVLLAALMSKPELKLCGNDE